VSEGPRILAITPDFPPAHGGIQVLVDRVLRHATSYRPRVVTFDGPGAAAHDAELPFEVRRVLPRPRPRPLAVLRLNAAAIREASRFRPDAVLSAHIVTSPAARAIRSRHGAPVVQYAYADELARRPRLARSALGGAQAVVALGEYTRRLALDLGADPGLVHVIPPGVDFRDDAEPRRDARPTIVTVGRLEDRFKGHDVVIRALPLIRRHVPDVLWAVAGDGTLRPELEREAEAAGVSDHVLFLGDVPDAERDRWLDAARAFVMPARLRAGGVGGEGFGIVYLEAGAHRLPVVAGAAGGALDAASAETGLLVDPTDERAVADAVVRLLSDGDLARRLGEAGHERARELAWPRVAARLERVLLEAAGAA
jgi:phosphatidylinositol alpha-1,6-mannosyltransferase